METLDCLELKTKPDLLIKVTNALCSGLSQGGGGSGGGGSGGGRAVLDAGPPIFTPDNKVWADQIWADQIWARRVCSAMKFDMLGRLMFTYVLKHIRKCFENNIATASAELQPLAVEIQRWKPKNKDQELERQLLLKELCIGRREMQMPTWLGHVSMPRRLQTFKRHQIDVFFPFPRSAIDNGIIDLEAEGRLFDKMFMDSTKNWRCNTYMQPMIDDLYITIQSATQRNVRVVHISGHCTKDFGFIWNADESGQTGKEFDLDTLARVIGSKAAQRGPIECIVLNSCKTLNFGEKLRQQGVPYILCWKTDVDDEIAREFTQEFYSALLQDDTRNYKIAFLVATGVMQSSKRSPTQSASFSTSAAGAAQVTAQFIRGGGGGKIIRTKNVIQFLSQDGDSESIHLLPQDRLEVGNLEEVRDTREMHHYNLSI